MSPNFSQSKPQSTLKLKEVVLLLTILGLATIAPPLNTPAGVYADPQVVLPVLFLLFFLGPLSRGALSIIPFWQVTVMFVSVLIIATFSSIIEGEGNFYGAMRLAKALVMFLGTLSFVCLIREKYGANTFRENLPLWIYLLISLNGIVMIAEFYSPSFYLFVRSSTLAGGFTSILWDPSADYRMPGLSLSGGAQVSLFQSIGILLFPIMLVTERKAFRKFVYVGFFVVNCFSVSISGRSGYYNIAVLSPLVLILMIWDAHVLNLKAVWSRLIGLGVVVCLVGAAIFYSVKYPEIIAKNFSEVLATAISRNADFLAGGDEGFVRNATIEVLWNDHIIWPSDLETWLIGNPEVMEDRGITRTLDSDIGYIVALHAFGLVSSAIQIVINLLPLYLALRYRRHAFRLGYTALIISASVLFFNSKEVMFFTRMAWPLQVVTFCALVYSLEEWKRDWYQGAFFATRRSIVLHNPSSYGH